MWPRPRVHETPPHDRAFPEASQGPVPNTRLSRECSGSEQPRPAESAQCSPGRLGQKEVSRTQKAERAGTETGRPLCRFRAPGTFQARNAEDQTDSCRLSLWGFQAAGLSGAPPARGGPQAVTARPRRVLKPVARPASSSPQLRVLPSRSVEFFPG